MGCWVGDVVGVDYDGDVGVGEFVVDVVYVFYCVVVDFGFG